MLRLGGGCARVWWSYATSFPTFLVKLVVVLAALPKAELLTWPLMEVMAELMKLDFPLPTGPYRRTRSLVTPSLSGRYFCRRSRTSWLSLRRRTVVRSSERSKHRGGRPED